VIVSIRPVTDPDSRPYWEYLKNKELRLQKCQVCGRLRFPPGPGCPYCGAPGGEWTPLSGRGTVYSWIVVHHPVDPRLKEDVPYTVALVELEEGPRVVARIICCPPGTIKGEMPVKGRFDVIDEGLTLLNFECLDEK